ncbi:hypothetical protein WG219_03520 [Ectopseudomonas mendocina]|uniref:Strictosidine synthase conserved region domain-containing protein n=1 Tax=Ectopseudomonas mendocina TaxID=300 RepID=A0ABZ2RIF8_ECTME
MGRGLKQWWWKGLGLFVLLVLAIGAYPAWRHLHPVSAADGWAYKVFADKIPMVSALAMDERVGLYLSQEFTSQRGKILLRKPNGEMSEVLTGLSKPDGLVMFNGSLIVGQEGGALPLLLDQSGNVQKLFDADSIEGVATDGRLLYAIEDRKQDGRLFSYDPQTAEVKVLREGLVQGEGIAACTDGAIYYTEKTHGLVKRWNPDGNDSVVASGLNAPGYVECSSDGLWITEDATHGARLLLLGADGKLLTVLTHLRSAQTIIELETGHYLLSEQGRGRILDVFRSPSA